MKTSLFLSLCGAACLSNYTIAQQPAAPVQANDFVQLFEKLSGPQPGHRRAHARGLCATGTFVPATSEAFADAALLSSGDLPVAMRFSVGSGNPEADERIPGARGMGMRIDIPEGGSHTFAGNNVPVQAGSTPDIFFGFLSTLLPNKNGERDPAKTVAYIGANPSVQANAAWLQSVQTPASYANTAFFGLHTFYYKVGEAKQTKFRWQLVPDLGVESLSAEQAAAKPASFLADKITEQLQQGEVSFTLQAEIGEPGDSDIDPSVRWPKDRSKVVLGSVRLSMAGGEACRIINFDPTSLSAGFSPSADPFLRMRSTAYAISFGKRLSGQ